MSTKDQAKLKEILQELNSTDTPIDLFYDQLEKEFGNKVPFSKFKITIEAFYSTISKINLFYLLAEIHLDSDGLINLTELFNYYSSLLARPISSLKLALYNVASRLDNQLRQSTIEFVFNQQLTLAQELAINEFYSLIALKLNLPDITAVIVFKALDVEKKGKIKVEDFVIVIDSYRTTASPASGAVIRDEGRENKYKLSDMQIYWVNKFCLLLESVSLTEKMAFDAVKTEEKEEEINLEAFKRKINLLLPKGRINATELNCIADAFDLNKNRALTYEEYASVIESCRTDPKMSTLIKGGENTFALMNYFISQTNDVKKLPLRTNAEFFTKYKPEAVKARSASEDEAKGSLFEEDVHYGRATNLAVSQEEMNQLSVKASKETQKKPTAVKAKTKPLFEGSEPFNKELSDFFKELDVFESGEWSLIELLEEFEMVNNSNCAPSFDVFRALSAKFSPTISKEKLSKCTNFIDDNADGFITYVDIINFLLHNFRHKSSKLGWKEVTRAILYDMHMSAEDFFNNNLVPQNGTAEVSFINFAQVIVKHFRIKPPLVKQMFDDLQNLIVTHKLTLGDIIDTINRQVEFNKSKEERRANLLSAQIKETTKDSPVSLLDKAYYKQEMKKFVALLQKGFIPSLDPSPSETFRANIVSFLNLPTQMKLSQFRELVIKPLCMDYSLGIATFQLVNSFEVKEDSNTLAAISTETFFNTLVSYIDYAVIDFDVKIFLFYLENGRYPALKLCLEGMEYNHKGMTVLELVKALEVFYPKVSKPLIKQLVRKIDLNTKGIVSYRALTDFLFNYSSKYLNQFSNELMLRSLASIADFKKVETEVMLREHLTKSASLGFNAIQSSASDFVSFKAHNEYFIGVLKLNVEQSENFFLFLSNVANQSCYTFNKIVKLINGIRTQPSIASDKETGRVVVLEETKTRSRKYAELLSVCHANVPLCEVLHRVNVSKTLEVSVNEIILSFNRFYAKIFDLNRSELVAFFKTMDKETAGSIAYPQLYKGIKAHCADFFCSEMHLRFLGQRINNEFDGKWNDYMGYKGVIGNCYLTKEKFSFCFKVDECFNEAAICDALFDVFKEKGGSHANLVYVQNLIDYYKGLLNQTLAGTEEVSFNLPESECLHIIQEAIERIEANGVWFISVFESINLNTQVNSFGKINWVNMRRYLEEAFSFDDKTTYAFGVYFCKVPMLFDLFKLCQICEKYSKSKVSLETIAKKIASTIPKDSTLSAFCRTYNLNPSKGLKPSELALFYRTLFELTTYECFFSFEKTWTHKDNPLLNQLKVSTVFYLKTLGVDALFKEEEEVKEDIDYISPTLQLALERFACYLARQKDVKALFSRFDKSGDKLLQRDEFLQMLEEASIDNLNQSGKISILNYIDRNKDGVINYEELIEFMSSFETSNVIAKVESVNKKEESREIIEEDEEDVDEDKHQEEEIAKSINFESQIDLEVIKANYAFNEKFLKRCSEPEKVFVALQKSIIASYPQSIEFQMFIASKDSTTLSIDAFIKLITNDIHKALSQETVAFLVDFSKDPPSKPGTKALTAINYKVFLSNLEQFVYIPKSENTASQNFAINAKIQAKLNKKYENRNIQFSSYFKQIFGKEFDFNNEASVLELKSALMRTFSFSEKEVNISKEINAKDLYSFKKFIEKLANVSNEEVVNDYVIKDEDYFVRPNGTKMMTIVNSEDAALKLCEDLFNSLSDTTAYFDEEFGSNPKKPKMNAQSLYYGATPPGQLDPMSIEWYRMKEISKAPEFLIDGSCANDVMQGSIGDCWFISALSVIATKDYLLRGEFKESILDDGIIDDEEFIMLSTGIYPPIFHSFRRRNIYCFRFYKNYQWLYVITDDRLPCRKVHYANQTPALVFGKCRNSDEFWVPLIEKAYAKLHGCYEALVSGFIDDGLVDLTGLVSKKYFFDDKDFSSITKVDAVWNEILDNTSDFLNAKNSIISKLADFKAFILTKNNSMLGCSIDSTNRNETEVIYQGEKCGLVCSHAYAILDAIEIPKLQSPKARKASRLLRLRNPWGYKEWNGKWSDNSEELERNKEAIQKAIEAKSTRSLPLAEEDGTFFICYQDFRNIFSKFYISYQFSPKYIGFYFEDRWTPEQSGGIPVDNTEKANVEWAKNPQYFLSIKQDTEVYVSIIQEDGRMTAYRYPFVETTQQSCLIIVKTQRKERLKTFSGANPVLISPIKRHRENSSQLRLPKGEYIFSVCAMNKTSNSKFRLYVYLEDRFTSLEFANADFMSHMENASMEKLGDPTCKPIYADEMNVKKLEKVNEKKTKLIFKQMKLTLTSEGKTA